MTRLIYDGVIEAVRFANDGRLSFARAYERRGPTYSDIVLLSREEIVRRLKKGQKFGIGTRRTYLASTFVMIAPVSMVGKPGKEQHLNIEETNNGDHPTGAPLF